MSQSKLEVADIFRRHGDAWRIANAGHDVVFCQGVLDLCAKIQPEWNIVDVHKNATVTEVARDAIANSSRNRVRNPRVYRR